MGKGKLLLFNLDTYLLFKKFYKNIESCCAIRDESLVLKYF